MSAAEMEHALEHVNTCIDTCPECKRLAGAALETKVGDD